MQFITYNIFNKMPNQQLILQYKNKHIDFKNNIYEFSAKITSNYTTHVCYVYINVFSYNNAINMGIIPNSVKFIHLVVSHKYTYCCIPNTIKHMSYDDHRYNNSIINNLLSTKWITTKNNYITFMHHKNIKKNTNIIFNINTICDNTFNKQNYFLMDNLHKICLIINKHIHFKQICYATKNINDVYIDLCYDVCYQDENIAKKLLHIDIYKNAYSLLIKNTYVIYNYYIKNVHKLTLFNHKFFIVKKQNMYATNYYMYIVCKNYIIKCEIIYFSKFVRKIYCY